MADTKTREHIGLRHYDKYCRDREYKTLFDPWDDSTRPNDMKRTFSAAMSEYSSHQNKELLERIKELENWIMSLSSAV